MKNDTIPEYILDHIKATYGQVDRIYQGTKARQLCNLGQIPTKLVDPLLGDTVVLNFDSIKNETGAVDVIQQICSICWEAVHTFTFIVVFQDSIPAEVLCNSSDMAADFDHCKHLNTGPHYSLMWFSYY